MLKNISGKFVTIKYNGITREVAPDGVVDVRDFGVSMKEIDGVQKHILSKNAGKFEANDIFGEAISENEKELLAENLRLKKEVETLKHYLDESSMALGNSQEALRNSKAELSGALKEIKEQKAEIRELKSKLKAAQ